MRMNRFALLAAGGIVLAFASGPALGQSWTVTYLKPVDYTGFIRVDAGTGGKFVGRAAAGAQDDPTVACLWDVLAGTFVFLGPDDLTTVATDTDGNQQVGYYDAGGPMHACLWSGTAASRIDIHPGAFTSSQLEGMSGNQQGGWVSGPSFEAHAGIWSGTAESFVSLHPPFGPSASWIYDCFNGKQVGAAKFGSQLRAVMWSGTAGSMVQLAPTGSGGSIAVAIHGEQQVGSINIGDNNIHAALWTGSAASWVDLHVAGYVDSQAVDVYDAVQVGYVWINDFDAQACLWMGTAGSFVNLHDELGAGWDSSIANAVWNDGQTLFVGGAANRINGRSEAILWSRPLFCPADFDHSGFVDTDDFDSFVQAFGAGTDDADFDGSGFVDTDDFDAFVRAFESGC